MRGQVGYLDVDDTSGYGPEHYYTTCSKMLTGNYTISLNYYRGSAPSVATLDVQAGN
jgi:uncharacterized protein YfaP (DUF2135 family)